MVSAGPDKRFGTEDDFTIDVRQRNIFALAGERLSEAARTTPSTAGKPLPGTVDALKRLARAGGLDLDAIFDPDGNPFLYEIGIGRRFYNVHVFRHDAQVQENGRLEGASTWSSPSIDYFSRTEEQMEAAIGQWTAAGKVFPATEAEARAGVRGCGNRLRRAARSAGPALRTAHQRADELHASGECEGRRQPGREKHAGDACVSRHPGTFAPPA
jgi:hypothetical protein